MAEGLPPLKANIAELIAEIAEDEDDWEVELPPDFVLIGTLGTEPKSLDDALSRPHVKEWQTALDYEIGQLQKLSTWVIEDLPKGHTAIPCSVVLKEKHGPDGEITSYRVHIVAGGHRQVEGVNYSETFSSAAKMPTMHVVLANATTQDWEIDHVDIKSVYLNVMLKETIYIHEGTVRSPQTRGRRQSLLPHKRPLQAEAGRSRLVPGDELGPNEGSWIHLLHC